MMNSLSSRLTYRIMAVVLTMMVVIAIVLYFSAKEYMLNEAEERYLSILDENRQELRRRLSDVYVAVKNNVYSIERDMDAPEQFVDHLQRIVNNNPNIVSCGLLFEPDYYPKMGRYFVPFAIRDTIGTVHTGRIDNVYNKYPDTDWFQMVKTNDKADWTGAYFESPLLLDDQGQRLLLTYSAPIHNSQGRPVALLCADMSLEGLRDKMMKDIRKMNDQYEKGQRHQSYLFVINQEGTYIIHPDKQRMMTPIDENMGITLQSHRGTCVMEVDGVKSWLYYRDIKFINWVMVIVVPEDAILSNARGLNIIILLVMIIGMVIIYLFCHYQIRKTTRPLHRFALSADQVAQGNFSSPLPKIKGDDEVRLLHDAFANMQTSLSVFVDELQKTTIEKASLERDLKIANAIQMAMVPKSLNSPLSSLNNKLDLYATLTPARDVGGDLYDYFLRDNRLFFCIGDVSGKGVPAALLMAVMRAMFRGETRRADSAVAIVDTINHNLSEEYTGGYFVTMFVGILDLISGHLDYCNAGHEAPVIAGQLLNVKPNLPVGALSDWNYEGQQAQLQPGDMLFLYTDGLSEAEDVNHDQFGRKHVLQLVSEHCTETAQHLVEIMEAEVRRHAAEAEQSDDITLLAIKWEQPERLMMPASMDNISRLKPYIAHVAGLVGIEDKEAKRLRLAVEEAVVNVINHGQATTITLQATVENNQLTLTIDDDGQPFDPTTDSKTDFSISADQRPPGGLGIMLLHKMTDGLTYQRIDGHNILTIIKK
ncbi:MAG: SpoIIE family protein phosphatase [Prevotella sp.]|nr:SpoIIE family protein phosphatase [Prevotella sp.]